jgi:hypothetical protein
MFFHQPRCAVIGTSVAIGNAVYVAVRNMSGGNWFPNYKGKLIPIIGYKAHAQLVSSVHKKAHIVTIYPYHLPKLYPHPDVSLPKGQAGTA